MGEPLTLNEAQDIIAEYAVQGDYYREQYRKMEDSYLPTLCKWFEGRTPGVVCEVGPGHGTMIPWLASRGWRVTVVDIMPRGHWISEELLSRYRTRYVQHDIIEAPLTRQFDVIVMTQVLPHLKYRADRALRNCAKMMKPGAPLISSALDAKLHPYIKTPYAHWCDVPEWGPTVRRCPEMVVCMFDEANYAELLGTVFAHSRIWRTPNGAVMFAESTD